MKNVVELNAEEVDSVAGSANSTNVENDGYATKDLVVIVVVVGVPAFAFFGMLFASAAICLIVSCIKRIRERQVSVAPMPMPSDP